MTTTEERLERIEKRLEAGPRGGGDAFAGCALIAVAILVNGCDPMGRGASGQRFDPQHVSLSTDSPLKVRLIDAAGRDVSFE